MSITRSSANKLSPYAWVILTVIYLASVVAPFNQFKVPPIMPVLLETFQVSLAQAGWFSDRIGSRRLVFALPYLAAAVMVIFPFHVTGIQITALMIIQGLLIGAIPTATYAAAPEIMRRPELAGLGLAVLLVGQNVGNLVGPVIFGELVKWLGWAPAGYLLVPVCLLGFLSGWAVRIR
jgi:MFS family permease